MRTTALDHHAVPVGDGALVAVIANQRAGLHLGVDANSDIVGLGQVDELHDRARPDLEQRRQDAARPDSRLITINEARAHAVSHVPVPAQKPSAWAHPGTVH